MSSNNSESVSSKNDYRTMVGKVNISLNNVYNQANKGNIENAIKSYEQIIENLGKTLSDIKNNRNISNDTNSNPISSNNLESVSNKNDYETMQYWLSQTLETSPINEPIFKLEYKNNVIKGYIYKDHLKIKGEGKGQIDIDMVLPLGDSYREHIKSVSFENINSIGMKAFYNFTNLTSITIPNSVKNVDKSAFFNCDKLIKVTISKR